MLVNVTLKGRFKKYMGFRLMECVCPCTHHSSDNKDNKPSKDEKQGKDLFINRWKLTLPDASETTEVTRDHLPHYKYTPSEITFRCKSNSGTTANTKYSRSELREMNGSQRASWETSSPHKMSYTFKVTKAPAKRPRIVIGQIHDSKDDVVELLADFTKGVFEVIHNTSHYGVLVDKIQLNEWYDITISTDSKGITCTQGSKKVFTPTKKKIPGCYFKIGNYLQSNEQDDESEVVVKNINLYQ